MSAAGRPPGTNLNTNYPWALEASGPKHTALALPLAHRPSPLPSSLTAANVNVSAIAGLQSCNFTSVEAVPPCLRERLDQLSSGAAVASAAGEAGVCAHGGGARASQAAGGPMC